MILISRKSGIVFLCAAFILANAGSLSLCGAEPTYNKEILPVLQKHCIACHHKGGLAPQSFEDYRSTRPWIKSSKKTVVEKSMPPWHADPAVGKWKNDGRLSAEEIKLIADWADAKGPEGDPAAAPPKIDFAKPWKLGEPGQVLAAAKFKVPAEGSDIFHAFVLAPEFAADTWVEGIELSPGAPDIVMQMSLSAVPTAAAKPAADAFDALKAAGAKDFIAAWNKGITLIEKAPAGAGILIPKGSSLVLYVHYKPVGEEVEVESKVGLHPAKGAPGKELKTASIETRELEIPAGAASQTAKAELKLDKGAKIISILPRMHYLGKSMEVTAHKPDGKSEKLLKVDDHSYDLQTTYTAAEPISLPAGTRIEVVASYDNTTDNPNNPNTTPKAAKYGPAPAGEIMSAVIAYIED